MKLLLRTLPLLTLMTMTGCGGSSELGGLLFLDIGPGNVFKPQTLTVKGGQSVTWLNGDSTAHTITRDTQQGPDSDANNPNGVAPGQTFFWTVPNAPSGTRFYYHCRFHGTAGDGKGFGTGMTGVIIVQ